MPSILQVINPDGSNNAVSGYGVPLADTASKDLLNQPMAEGKYAFTTKNKLTVLQIDIMQLSKVQGFSIPTTKEDCESAELTGQKFERAHNAKCLINVLIKGFDPSVLDTVTFVLNISERLGTLSDGVVADPLAEVYRMPSDLRLQKKLDSRVDFREVASVKAFRLDDGVWVSTRGLIKFNLPEYEMYGISDELVETAYKMLIAAGQQSLLEIPLKPGDTAYSLQSPMEIVYGQRQKQIWGNRPVLEIKDKNGNSAINGVKSWKEQGN